MTECMTKDDEKPACLKSSRSNSDFREFLPQRLVFKGCLPESAASKIPNSGPKEVNRGVSAGASARQTLHPAMRLKRQLSITGSASASTNTRRASSAGGSGLTAHPLPMPLDCTAPAPKKHALCPLDDQIVVHQAVQTDSDLDVGSRLEVGSAQFCFNEEKEGMQMQIHELEVSLHRCQEELQQCQKRMSVANITSEICSKALSDTVCQSARTMDTLHGVAEPLAAAAVELQALQQQLCLAQQQHKEAVQQLHQQSEESKLRVQEAVQQLHQQSEESKLRVQEAQAQVEGLRKELHGRKVEEGSVQHEVKTMALKMRQQEHQLSQLVREVTELHRKLKEAESWGALMESEATMQQERCKAAEEVAEASQQEAQIAGLEAEAVQRESQQRTDNALDLARTRGRDAEEARAHLSAALHGRRQEEIRVLELIEELHDLRIEVEVLRKQDQVGLRQAMVGGLADFEVKPELLRKKLHSVCQGVQVCPYDLTIDPDQAISCQPISLHAHDIHGQGKEASRFGSEQAQGLTASLAASEARAVAAESAASSRQAEVELLQSTLQHLRREVGSLRTALDCLRSHEHEEVLSICASSSNLSRCEAQSAVVAEAKDDLPSNQQSDGSYVMCLRQQEISSTLLLQSTTSSQYEAPVQNICQEQAESHKAIHEDTSFIELQRTRGPQNESQAAQIDKHPKRCRRPLVGAVRIAWGLLRTSTVLGVLAAGSVAASRTPLGRRCVEYTEGRCRSLAAELMGKKRQPCCLPVSSAEHSQEGLEGSTQVGEEAQQLHNAVPLCSGILDNAGVTTSATTCDKE
ncbi:hypothetical protein CEUSTIGMA_g9216.t1 [Chlamydomonas eustigma]|uniref:Uncharacterized protein n=1 Tax=Chlamydomonas eustigma TaxID=1157962 RepID=A0A250XFC0_9CHLO|nr:hypothetical protein CEUSTIGMA_g9216.t1 [Chlamydomonas eustigma]|eukprot:GAX81788.1 hypothetical protein CEUSTIGMA_g9216.t1 [Chlamydomonas eustigma]